MIDLIAMTRADYEAFLSHATAAYADANVEAGRWPKEGARERSAKAHADLLPQGLESPGHFLYSICLKGSTERAGYLWVKVDEGAGDAFIYQIEIFPNHRRKGLATAAIEEIAAGLKEKGIRNLGLHVFGFNEGAIELYKKQGFEVTSLNMLRRL